MAAGQYCDVISGQLSTSGRTCTGRVVTVAADGTAHFTVPIGTAPATMAIHWREKIGRGESMTLLMFLLVVYVIIKEPQPGSLGLYITRHSVVGTGERLAVVVPLHSSTNYPE